MCGRGVESLQCHERKANATGVALDAASGGDLTSASSHIRLPYEPLAADTFRLHMKMQASTMERGNDAQTKAILAQVADMLLDRKSQMRDVLMAVEQRLSPQANERALGIALGVAKEDDA